MPRGNQRVYEMKTRERTRAGEKDAHVQQELTEETEKRRSMIIFHAVSVASVSSCKYIGRGLKGRLKIRPALKLPVALRHNWRGNFPIESKRIPGNARIQLRRMHS